MKIILSAFNKNTQVYNSHTVKEILERHKQILTENSII